MFSMMPITGRCRPSEKTTVFRESSNATSWGVVTTMEPSALGINCAMVSGSSPVPGGRSTMR